MTRIVGIALAALVLAVLGRLLLPPIPDRAPPPARDVVGFLAAGDGGGYARVVPGPGPEFPRDHGAHPGFRQEWWYVTGNLADAAGRRFGFQLTFFRFAHGAVAEYADSAWRHDQSWMAHFAISDLDNRRLLAYQDYARGTLGLAGATARPFAVWVNAWSARGDADADGLSMVLDAAVEEASIALEVTADRPPLLQGEGGYSRKDAAGEVASWYYSVPGMAAVGELRLGDSVFRVSGRAWMDHEWSTEVLSREQSGWDWFALDLDDGAQLMVFQVRGDDAAAFRHAVLRRPDGSVARTEQGVRMEPGRVWESPSTGARYPVSWRLEIPAFDLGLDVAAAFPEQELALDFSYWEGVVDVSGRRAGGDVGGQGYMELTGY